MPIAFDRFIEAKCGNAIDFCQIPIKHYSHAADRADHRVDLLDCGRALVFFATGGKDYSKFLR